MEIQTVSWHEDKLWEKVAACAAGCSWQPTGRFLSDRMRSHDFSDWERVFAACEGDSIAGFCALSKTSSAFGELYAPYIGFVFVGEAYRGRRISGDLCTSALRYAEAAGFSAVYLYSDLVNFYEKYGFVKIDEKESPWGVRQSIYRHTT